MVRLKKMHLKYGHVPVYYTIRNNLKNDAYHGNNFLVPCFQMSASHYKQVLLGLHEKVMPHFTNPLLLSDFLTESYNIGDYFIFSL